MQRFIFHLLKSYCMADTRGPLLCPPREPIPALSEDHSGLPAGPDIDPAVPDVPARQKGLSCSHHYTAHSSNQDN